MLNLDKRTEMWYNRAMTKFLKYLKNRLQHHENILTVIEHSNEYYEIEKQRLLRDQLIDIILHFEEFVKDELEDS